MKRKKNSRMRGSHTHGYGAKKKHRGAGSRGGRGNAGSGKRGDAKKPGMQVRGYRAGKSGFKRGTVPNVDAIINIGMLEQQIDAFIIENIAVKKGDVIEIDLGKAGYTKLLSKGSVSTKMHITIEKATPKAIEKIKAQGGQIANLKNTEQQKEPQ